MAVYEPVDAAEITFAQPNASLRIAADEYCETARERGLAQGESTLGGLAGVLLGKDTTADKYWAAIDEETVTVDQAVELIRADLTSRSAGLEALNGLAMELVNTGEPARTDVNKFESALIHARQSRQSLSEAIQKVAGEGGLTGDLTAELGSFDEAIERAVATADRLAEARTSREIAGANARQAAG